ncbi:MAG: ATP-binding cassette domain-containing protein [Rhizobacter sp.]
MSTDTQWLARRLPDFVSGLRRLARAELAQLSSAPSAEPQAAAAQACALLKLDTLQWSDLADATTLPMLAVVPGLGLCIVYAEAGPQAWLVDTTEGTQRLPRNVPGSQYAALRNASPEADNPSAKSLFRRVLREQRPTFAVAALAALLANVVALAGSLYSMQVYDRVIPTQGISTLTVLTIGALFACVFELIIKLARSSILDGAVRRMDGALSHAMFKRLLALRLDQLPASVGSLSAQLRSYESIRAFATAATLYAVVDAPFALLFLAVMWMLAGPELVAVPAVCFVLALLVGGMYRARIAAHAGTATAAGNRKLGLLVETVENAENLKASGAGWVQMAKWNTLNRQSIDDELKIKHYSEASTFFAGFVQQSSYIVMIAVGAYIASTSGNLTTGGLIACSILSGRVLAPIAMLPGLIVQWAHARTALENLERVFTLEQDHHGVAQPLTPDNIRGEFRIEDLRFAYPGRPPVVALAQLNIRAGEKVAILGPVGAGKSTLLKLMAGLYKPQQGRVLIDGLDAQQISREHLSQHVGYMPQEVRLLAGTLRDNLGAGLTNVDEARMLAACQATGLMTLVARHPKGLDLEIGEGGTGVSGGQRRLIGLTRLVLARPAVWLLDEPTSSMDEMTERQSLNLLAQAMTREQTLVLVTHKPQLLALAERIVVMTHEGVAMDGPRNAVLKALEDNGRAQAASAQQAAAQQQLKAVA